MHSSSLLLAFAACWTQITAHLVITYPGWRGNNLKNTGNTDNPNNAGIPDDGLGVSISANNSKELVYPYGMQWIYPCGGMPTSTNRTKWPVTGGALSFQPGWFSGHQTAFIYINMGIGTVPPNMSHPMVPVFQITGPSNNMYPGTFCLPQVPTPANVTFNVGDNATIQIIETAVHGAALYSCVDITFADPHDVALVTPDNCFNSTAGRNNGGPIGLNFVYTATGLTAGSASVVVSWTTFLVLLAATTFAMLM